MSIGKCLSVLALLSVGVVAFDCSSVGYTDHQCANSIPGSNKQTFTLDAGSNGVDTWFISSALATIDGSTLTYDRTKASGCADQTFTVTLKTTDGGLCPLDIIAHDTDAPVLTGQTGVLPSGFVVVEVDSVADAATVLAVDHCQGTVVVNLVEEKSNVMHDASSVDKGLFSLTRTWSAHDKCGAAVEHVQYVDVIDETAPTFDVSPGDLVLSCDDADLATTCDIQASDNSDMEVVVVQTLDDRVGECANSYVRNQAWSATDSVGNVATHSRSVIIYDKQPPSLMNLPVGSITAECDAVPAFADVTANDNCDDVTVQHSQTSTPNGASGDILYRTWTSADSCGNSATFTQTITTVDSTPPEMLIESDVTAECSARPPQPCMATLKDNCDESPNVVMAEIRVNGTCANEYQLVHQYTASDIAGNSVSQARTVTVSDNSTPVLKLAGVPVTVPLSKTVDCNLDSYPYLSLTASDACEPDLSAADIVTNSDEKLSGTDYNYDVLRTWDVVDACGHSAHAEETVTVVDITAPVFAHTDDIHGTDSITVACSAIPPAQEVTATDACCAATVVYKQTIENQVCENSYDIRRVWVATDCAGNSNTFTRVITVTAELPTFNYAFTDGATDPVEWTSTLDLVAPTVTLTTAPGCAAIDLVPASDVVPSSCDHEWRVIRVWSVTDGCLNSESISQTISVGDTQAPILTQPSDRSTGGCAFSGNEDFGVTAEDQNGGGSVTVDTDCAAPVGGSCDHAGSVTCTFSASDVCGNSAFVTATETWADVAAPYLTCSGSSTSDGSSTVADNCDNDIEIQDSGVIPDYTATDNCNQMYVNNRQHTAVDACGTVAASCDWADVIMDTTPPTFVESLPQDQTLTCLNAEVPTQDTLTMSDDFTSATVNATSATTGQSNCGRVITYTWAGEDCAGNSNSHSQVITILEDNTLASFSSEPADYTLEACSDAPTFADLTVSYSACVTETYPVTAHVVGPVTLDAGLVSEHVTYTATWTWSDAANCQSLSHTQVVTIRDTTAPVLTLDPVTYECDSVDNEPSVDDCSPTTCTMDSTTKGVPTDHCYTYTNTWTCTDARGLSSSITGTITVEDNNAPVLSDKPADITEDCLHTATCDTLSIGYTETCAGNGNVTCSESGGVVNNQGSYTQTWTISDSCGQSDSHTRVVTIEDNEDPVLTCTADDFNGGCHDAPGPGSCTATDNCVADIVVTYSGEPSLYTGNCAVSGHDVHTWTATDDAGNTAVETQTIIWDDVTPPELTGWTTVTADVEWGANITAYNPETAILASLSDNCGTPTVSCSSIMTQDHACHKRHTFSCTAVDDCGNELPITGAAVIDEYDNRVPTLSDKPADVMHPCDEAVPAAGSITSLVGTVTGGHDQYSGVGGLGCQTMTRTWNVEWCAGTPLAKSDSHTQTFTFFDYQAPTISVPTYLDDACSVQPKGAVSAVDTCTASVTLVYSETNSTVDRGTQYVRSVTASDECGNEVSKVQTFTVQDHEDPVWSETMGPQTLEAPATYTTVHPTATDNCQTVTVDHTSVPTTDPTCPHRHTTVNVWTATDLVGNSVTQQQTVTSDDTKAPVFSWPAAAPGPLNIDYADLDLHPAVTATAYDAGDTAPVTVSFNEIMVNETAIHNYQLVRTWSATDACSNEATHTQTVTVTQSTVCQPEDVIVECDATANVKSAAWHINNCTDYLNDDVDITVQTSNSPQSCAQENVEIRVFNIADTVTTHSVQVTQTITVIDTTAPAFAPADIDTTSSETLDKDNCAVNPAPVKNAVDACDATVSTSTPVTTPSTSGHTTVYTTVYTVADACGNVQTTSHVHTVTDDRRPVWNADIQIDATADCTIPDIAVPTCTSPCDLEACVVSTTNDVSNGICPTTVNRAWSATVNGYTITHSRVITVVDETDPVVVPGSAIAASCDPTSASFAPSATASDVCDGVLSVTTTPNFAACTKSAGENCNSITGSYTHCATDACGNTDCADQGYTYAADVAPVLDMSLTQDYTAECTDSVAFQLPTVSDDCDNSLTVVNTPGPEIPGTSPQVLFTKVYTFSVVDSDGLTDTESITATIMDTSPPTLSGVPADGVHHQCPIDDHTVSFSDNCDATGPVTPTTVAGTDGWYTLTWKYCDAGGNCAEESRTEKIEDTTPPTFDSMTTTSTPLGCGESFPEIVTVTGTDNCPTDNGNALTAVCTPDDAGNDCDGHSRTVTCVLTDQSTNTASETASYTISAVTANQYVCNAVTHSSTSCVDPHTAHGVTCSDPCNGGADVPLLDGAVSTSVVQKSDGCAVEGTRTYATATDNCGRVHTVVQNVLSLDNIPPTFDNAPLDTTEDCSVTAWEMPAVSDSCGLAQVEVVSDTVGDWTGGFKDYTTVFRATDECGLTTDHTLVRTAKDVEDPVLSPASIPDVDADCTDTVTAPVVTVTDNCDVSITVVPNHDATGAYPDGQGSVVTQRLTYRYSATDASGNVASLTHVVTKKDNTPPTIHGNTDTVVVSCANVPNVVFTASDACSESNGQTAQLVNADPVVSNSCGLTGTTVYSATATDHSGLTSSVTKTVIVVDLEAPVLSYSDSSWTSDGQMDVSCTEYDTWSPPVCTANDGACTNDAIACTHEKADIGNHKYTYTYTASDTCGNSNTQVLTVSVVDNIDPVFDNVDADATVDCLSSFVPSITASDSCSARYGDISLTSNEDACNSVPGCTGEEVLTCAWTATDVSGNTISHTGVYTKDDSKGPSVNVLTGASGHTDCDQVPAAPTASCTDDCGDCSITVQPTPTGNKCVGSASYEISAVDSCGNIDVTQTKTITNTWSDASPPSIIASYTPVVAASAGDTVALPVVTASDNCGDASVVFSENVDDSNPCAVVHIRTWTATDECGLVDFITQTITFTEDTKPVLSDVPLDFTAECGNTDFFDSIVPPSAKDRNNNFLTVSDSQQKTSTGACACDHQIVITWTAEDSCTNIHAAATTVSFSDNTPPTFLCEADNIAASCYADVPAAKTMEASDVNFGDGNPTQEITAVDTHSTPSGCGDISFIRTYTATDCSGNFAVHQQSVAVADSVAPVFSRLPGSIVVECGCDTVPQAFPLNLVDNCDGTGQADATDVRLDGEPLSSDLPGVITRTWQHIDACGNSVSHTQSITIQDSKAPALVGCPSDASVSCEEYTASKPAVSASDECDAHVTVDFVESITNSEGEGSCAQMYSVTRVWSAVDDSGNQANKTQVISVGDQVAPALSGVSNVPNCLAPDETETYSTDADALFPLYDNCDEAAFAEIVSCNVTGTATCTVDAATGTVSITSGLVADNTVVVYGSLEDACGNVASVSHAFTVKATVQEAAENSCAFPGN